MENFKLEELKIFGQPLTQEFILESYQVSLYTFLMLVVLEVYSWDNVWRKTAEKEANWALYIKAMWTNAEHYLVYGPVAYAIVSAYVKSTGSFYPSYISLPGVLMVQAIGFVTYLPILYAVQGCYDDIFVLPPSNMGCITSFLTVPFSL